MRIIHSLPPCMRTLQTILLEQAPDSSTPSWDLLKLKQQIVTDETWAHIAGENLGTKRAGTSESQALAVRAGGFRAKKDPNDPVWLVQCKREREKTRSTLDPNPNRDQVRNKGAG